MSTASAIDPIIIQAYLETDYRVHGDAPMTLSVGVTSTALAELYKKLNVNTSAYITACNPLSQACDEAINSARQEEFLHELRTRGLKVIDGIGQHPSNQWPGEVSFLVLDISLEAAKAMGVRHEQNAIIWCGPDALPQLILLK